MGKGRILTRLVSPCLLIILVLPSFGPVHPHFPPPISRNVR